jgi:hypothetical protein
LGIFKVFLKKFAKFLIYVFKSLILILLTAARAVTTNVMEMLAISETSAPSVTPLWRRDTGLAQNAKNCFSLYN